MIRPERARSQQPVNLKALANPYLRSVWRVIPEPSTALLVATGLGILALRRQRVSQF